VITNVSHMCVFVLDQDSAKAFYTEKLGFEVRFDLVMGDGFEGAGAGFRWLTVGPKDQPGFQVVLSDCGVGRDPESAGKLRELVASGSIGPGVMTTDDCKATYEELVARGVTFTQAPSERPYGVEAVFRDDSGNWFSLTQPFRPPG
jgi:catechol 2,3-dioxygenase-like lactoylglutathione lyase family enzyme